jgi:hypothetical protein
MTLMCKTNIAGIKANDEGTGMGVDLEIQGLEQANLTIMVELGSIRWLEVGG